MTKVVKLVLPYVTDINLRDGDGYTMLHYVAQTGNYDSMKLLLEAGADVNATTEQCKSTALMYAVFELNHDECTRILLQAGADANMLPKPSKVEFKNKRLAVEFVAFLLLSGSIINQVNDRGSNALTTHLTLSNTWKGKTDDDVVMLLYAAGEYITDSNIEKPECLEFDLTLQHLCREAIRDHLIDLDEHTQLFPRVAQLNLPPLIKSYLLFDESPQKYHSDCVE